MTDITDLSQVQARLVDSWDELQAFMTWLGERRPVMALDLETEGLDWWRMKIRTTQFGDAQTGWVIPHEQWRGAVQHVADNYDGEYVLHNAAFDLRFLEADGIQFPHDRVHDTRIQAALIDPDRRTGLKPLADQYISPVASHGEKLLKDGMSKNNWDWATVPIDFEPYWAYGALDVVFTARLHEMQMKYMHGKTGELYDLERRCQIVLMRMTQQGARLDMAYLHRKRSELLEHRDYLAAVAEREHGVEKLGSSQKIAEALQAQGWEPEVLTDTGRPSTGDAVLSKLDYPLAKIVTEYRHASKVIRSYFDNLIELADGEFIHADINPLGARTGRMSVSRPSLQNLHRDALVRDAFIPRPGNKLMLIDYDQMELRVLADMGNVTGMIQAFATEPDVHSWMAAKIYGLDKPVEKKDPRRQLTKNAMYTRIYGGGPAKFAETAGLPVSDGYEFYDMVDAAFPEITAFTRDVEQTAKDMGAKYNCNPYVHTELGRFQPVPLDHTYKLNNYLIQGTCADLLKRTLVELDAAGFAEYMLLPVHDEIVFDVPAEQADELLVEAQKIMTIERRVPLTVDGDIVDRWGDNYRGEL